MLQGIKLNNSLPDTFFGTEFFGILKDINTVNTFIGVNNSGKSRFLRTLFSNSKDVKFITTFDTATIVRLRSSSKPIFDSLLNLKRYNIKYKYPTQIEIFKKEIESDNKIY